MARQGGTALNRDAFLARIRRELSGFEQGGAPERGAQESQHPIPDLPPTWPATPASGDGGVPAERFERALAACGGAARLVRREALSGAVADALREVRSGRRVVVAPDVEPFRADVDRGLEDAHAEIVRPLADAWRDEASTADWGITSAVLGIASTGSVLIVPGSGSPRVASLLPPAHLVILPVDRLVAGLEEAMPVVASAASSSSSAVLVTGPSRTSDIEMVSVTGVHGPKVLRVLLVEPGDQG